MTDILPAVLGLLVLGLLSLLLWLSCVLPPPRRPEGES